ncbi:MAG TPA: hypothetical protein VKB79_22330 [Bryobacteraceae bacterium]|nr:hypothetical protein [Bryobacteraceae bacterium]
MRYRVVYKKRFNQSGGEADSPPSYLNLADGVVAEAEFVERFEPPSLHVEEDMEEDDAFLSLGSEVWEYDVVDGREQEFRDAVTNTGMAIEVERVEEVEDLPALGGQ